MSLPNVNEVPSLYAIVTEQGILIPPHPHQPVMDYDTGLKVIGFLQTINPNHDYQLHQAEVSMTPIDDLKGIDNE